MFGKRKKECDQCNERTLRGSVMCARCNHSDGCRPEHMFDIVAESRSIHARQIVRLARSYLLIRESDARRESVQFVFRSQSLTPWNGSGRVNFSYFTMSTRALDRRRLARLERRERKTSTCCRMTSIIFKCRRRDRQTGQLIVNACLNKRAE